MKLKYIALGLVAGLVYSCASKSSSASTPTPPPTPNTVVAGAPTENAKEIMADAASGKVAYENHCGKCHKLFEPKEFSKTDWAPILVRMQKKAHLSDAEMAPITNYIYTQL